MGVTKILREIGVSLSIMDNPADGLFENPSTTFPKLAVLWSRLTPDERLEYKQAPDSTLFGTNHFHSGIENDSDPCSTRHNVVIHNGQHGKANSKLSCDELVQFCGDHQLSNFQQFSLLLKRNIRQATRDKIFFYGRYAAFLFAGLLIGLSFQGIGTASEKAYFNTATLYFCTNAMLAAPALMAVMQAERNFLSYIRENINGWYKPSSFFLARSVLEWFFQSTTTLMFGILTWQLTSQYNPGSTLPMALAILTTQAICCYHMMFIFSLFLDSQTNFQLPFLLSTVQCLFGGYLIPPNNLPHVFFYISKFNFGLYSYLGLMKIVYSPHNGEEFELTCKSENPLLCNRFRNGTSILEANNVEAGSGGEEIAILFAFATVYMLLGLPAIIRRTNGAKNEIARVTNKDKKANAELKKKVTKC